MRVRCSLTSLTSPHYLPRGEVRFQRMQTKLSANVAASQYDEHIRGEGTPTTSSLRIRSSKPRTITVSKKSEGKKVATSSLPPPKAEPDCDVCGLRATSTCSGCGSTHYCSRACQLKHWPRHKISCKASPIYKANQELAALKKKLAEQEQTLGVDHVETLRKVNEIGMLLSEQGKLKEAEDYHLRALDGSERVLGPDHPNTLAAAINLGTLLQNQGKRKEAERLFRRALDGNERALGRDHRNTLLSACLSTTWACCCKYRASLASPSPYFVAISRDVSEFTGPMTLRRLQRLVTRACC